MRTIEILTLLQSFDRVLGDEALTTEDKKAVGEELLRQLPHAHLVPSVQASLAAVHKSVAASLAKLETDSGSGSETGRSKGPKNASGAQNVLRKATRNT